MEITEVRIKLMEDNSGSNERLQAFCSITFDDMFVIRDLKIIEGAKGFFVAMPSRKLTDRCHNCGTKNHLRSRFCNQCGMPPGREPRPPRRRRPSQAPRRHRTSDQLRAAGRRSRRPCWPPTPTSSSAPSMPGYVSRYDDIDGGEFDFNPYETSLPGAAAAHGEPPLRRGPLRSHTQHSRGGSVLRGPHVPNRRDSEGIGADQRGDAASGFGSGL